MSARILKFGVMVDDGSIAELVEVLPRIREINDFAGEIIEGIIAKDARPYLTHELHKILKGDGS